MKAKKTILALLCGTLIGLCSCTVDRDGAANLLVSNSSSLRARCLVDDGVSVVGFWVESLEESSLLLDIGEYRVKIELYRGERAAAARLYTLSMTTIGRVHQLLIDDSWVDGGVLQ